MFILASASPRRKELLSKMGIDFKIVQSDFDESINCAGANDYAIKCAMGKAKKVIEAIFIGGLSLRHGDEHRVDELTVLGADTVVVTGNKIWGKPKSHSEARQMLMQICGKTHTVVSGICIITSKTLDTNVDLDSLKDLAIKSQFKIENLSINGEKYNVLSACESTSLCIKNLTNSQMDSYIKSGSPFDKAGGYGIQDEIIFNNIKHIDGSIDNVVGLPTELIASILSLLS